MNKAINKQSLGITGFGRGRGEMNFSGWATHGYYGHGGFSNWGSNRQGWRGHHDSPREWGTSRLNIPDYGAYYGSVGQSGDSYEKSFDYGAALQNYASTYDTASGGGPIRSSTNSISVGSQGGYRSWPYGKNVATFRGRGTAVEGTTSDIREQRNE